MLRSDGRGGRALVAAAGLALLAAGCGHHGDTKLKAGNLERKVVVSVAPVESRLVERTIGMVGSLRGWEQVTVGSKKTGRVIKVLHDMGDLVEEGEPIVELDSIDARLAVDQARSRYLGELVKLGITQEQADSFVSEMGLTEELLQGKTVEQIIKRVPAVKQMEAAMERVESNLNRQRQITQRGAGSIQDLQNYENDYAAARAAYDNAIFTARTVIALAMANRVALAQANQALEDMTVRAPRPTSRPEGIGPEAKMSYALTKRVVSEGQMLREGDPVCDLVLANPLRMWGNVPERYIDEVKLGQKVRLDVAAFPGETFTGRVARINPSINELSRTFQVEVQVPNPKGRLHAGGFAKAAIVTEAEAGAVVVPTESILRDSGVVKLFLVEGDLSREVEVETGVEGAGWTEVKGAISPGAQVVVTGQAQLADRTPVIVRQPPPEPEEKPAAKGEGEAGASKTDGPAKQGEHGAEGEGRK